MSQKPVEEVLVAHSTENTKSVFLCKGKYQVSMQIDGETAWFGLEDTSTPNFGHEVAIGLRDGEGFLQVAVEGVVNIIPLKDVVNVVMSHPNLLRRLDDLESKVGV